MVEVDAGQHPWRMQWRRRSMISAGLAALMASSRARADATSLTFGQTPVFLPEDQELLRLIREVAIPPLRAPRDAIWLLRRFFQAAIDKRPGPLRTISPSAEEAVAAHAWPGNVRELRNRVDRGVALARGTVLSVADLFPEAGEAPDAAEPFALLAEVRDAAERRQILRAIEQTGGRVAEAARLLGVSRTTLWEKMQRLGL